MRPLANYVLEPGRGSSVPIDLFTFIRHPLTGPPVKKLMVHDSGALWQVVGVKDLVAKVLEQSSVQGLLEEVMVVLGWQLASEKEGARLVRASIKGDEFIRVFSLQALLDLNYLFGGFIDYLSSRELNISNFGPADRKFLPVSEDDMTYSCLIEYPKHSALTARIWM
nr:hypothetical protein [Tanacetum cinerariifolium]